MSFYSCFSWPNFYSTEASDASSAIFAANCHVNDWVVLVSSLVFLLSNWVVTFTFGDNTLFSWLFPVDGVLVWEYHFFKQNQ